METTNDCFIAALKKKLKEQGRGAKQKFAAQVIVSPNHLSDILSQRKNAGQKLKERMVDALGVSFENMLVLGRHILEDHPNETLNEGSEIGGEALEKESNTTADFMVMATKILEGNTPYRQALMSNIIAYCQAIDTTHKEEQALRMVGSLQEEMGIMRKDIEELKQSDNDENGTTLNTSVA